jgi:hypothetical protein
LAFLLIKNRQQADELVNTLPVQVCSKTTRGSLLASLAKQVRMHPQNGHLSAHSVQQAPAVVSKLQAAMPALLDPSAVQRAACPASYANLAPPAAKRGQQRACPAPLESTARAQAPHHALIVDWGSTRPWQGLRLAVLVLQVHMRQSLLWYIAANVV